MTTLALSIGSNIDAGNNLRRVRRALLGEFGNIRCSTVYESEAVGFAGDNFLNLAALIETELPLQLIAGKLKQIEHILGRDRKQPRYSGRTMDIDILVYGFTDGAECGMELPREEISRNAFVLCPLAEMLPNTVHSRTGKSFLQMWQGFDKSRQKIWPVEFDWTQS